MSMTAASLDPPRFRCLLGTTPGLLDPTQPARVLRGLGWKLTFVTLEDMKDPTCAEADGMRRIAVDEPPMGAGAPQCRLIPNAELGPGVTNEGKTWPRIVDLCGEFVVCSREQWYIYKLDPAYQCYVPLHPHPPIISRKETDPRNDQGKREAPDTAGDVERLTKRFRTTLSFDDTGSAKASRPAGSKAAPQVDVAVVDLPMEDPSATSQPPVNMTANTSDAVPHSESSTVVENPDDDAPNALHDHHPFSNSNGSEIDPDVIMRSATPRPTTDPDTTTSASTSHSNDSHAGAFLGPSATDHDEDATTVGRSDELRPELQPNARLPANIPLGESAAQPSARPEVIDVDMEIEDRNYPEQYRAKRKERQPDHASGEQPPIRKDLEPEHLPKRRRTTDPTTPSKESAREAKRKAMRRSERITKKKLREEVIQDDRRRREEEFWREMLKSEEPEPEPPATSNVSVLTESSSSGSSSLSSGSSSSSSGSSSSSSGSSSSSSGSSSSGSSSSGSSSSGSSSSRSSSSGSASSRSSSSGSASSSSPETPEEAERWASILESRRKIAELEKDKPLWEEHQKRRAEEEARKAMEAATAAAAAADERRIAEEKRRAAERERQLAEQVDTRGAATRRARDLKRRGREERKRVAGRYSRQKWTTEAAIRHYVEAAKRFDGANFSPENPPLFETIPWPTLLEPWLVKEEHITWDAVEQFFHEARCKMLSPRFKELVDATHKRFHPDRLRGRNMAKSVEHEELADQLSRCANLVAQAVTPIWRQCRLK